MLQAQGPRPGAHSGVIATVALAVNLLTLTYFVLLVHTHSYIKREKNKNRAICGTTKAQHFEGYNGLFLVC